jgi:hypothetical protein
MTTDEFQIAVARPNSRRGPDRLPSGWDRPKDHMVTLQELADEAFRRPTTLKKMLRESVRSHPVIDHAPERKRRQS